MIENFNFKNLYGLGILHFLTSYHPQWPDECVLPPFVIYESNPIIASPYDSHVRYILTQSAAMIITMNYCPVRLCCWTAFNDSNQERDKQCSCRCSLSSHTVWSLSDVVADLICDINLATTSVQTAHHSLKLASLTNLLKLQRVTPTISLDLLRIVLQL